MKDQELLSAYLDGELAPAVARQVEERLKTDPGLRQEHHRLRRVSIALQVRCDPDPGFLVRHRQRREELSPVLQWTWRQLGYRLAAVAATMLIAAGVSVWQAEPPPADMLADTATAGEEAAEELDVLAFGGQILGGQILGSEMPAASDFEFLAASGPTEEPVLLIALGAGFAPAGER